MKNRTLNIILKLIPELILAVTIIAIIFGEYVCPFYYLFNIPCPGCGMTRACKSLLRLDFGRALDYNYLFPIPIFWAWYHLFRRQIAFSRKAENALLVMSCAAFILRWLLILIFI